MLHAKRRWSAEAQNLLAFHALPFSGLVAREALDLISCIISNIVRTN